ncbi:MAG: hypothetical protein ACXVZL_02450 [Gaiellaceae bacterium]
MGLRVTVVLLAAGLLAAGCGGNSGQRKAVAGYITAADALQVKLAKPLLAVTKADGAFAKGKAKPGDVQRRLSAAGVQIRRLRGQLAALTPPPPARKLHTLLLRLVDREVSLTDEVGQMAGFFPRFAAALAPVAPASKTLQHVLAGKGTTAAKAAALERYSATLAGVLVQLRLLKPPPVSAPVYRTQLTTIVNVRASADALALAVRQTRSNDVRRLLHDFDLASVGNQSVAAQTAQIQAVRAYNARVRSVATLTAQIAKERTRLQKSL